LRRPTFALTSALAALGLTAGVALAQQPSPTGGRAPSPSAETADGTMAQRPAARYMLRNGMDYLAYREYDRALSFFRAIEARKDELSEGERQQLKKGIARAQDGKREAINSPRVVATRKGRAANPPGAFALAKAPAPAPEPVQLTSGTLPAAEPAPASVAVAAAAPLPAMLPTAVAAPAAVASDGLDLPRLPAAPPQALPDLSTSPAADPSPAIPEPAAPAPAPTPAPAALPEPGPVPASAPIGLEPIAPAPAVEPSSPLELPTLPTDPAQSPAPAPATDPATAPAEATMPALAMPDMPRQVDPASAPAPESPPIPTQPIEPPPAPEASTLPTGPAQAQASSRTDGDAASERRRMISSMPDASGSLLSPGHREEVDRIAQRPSDVMGADRGAAGATDPNAAAAPAQGSTRLELPRAPSPTEARPLRRVAVPEEFVPLGKREWNPNRKYWAAAGTCHMTLYFQDPVLERYGQGVEQALGPNGRFFSYPLDDPKQSNQRNQILQPFYSIGKFCFQVGTFPYKVFMDPPWEAEYDLGYYRPGDRIPPDTVYITPTGVGAPGKGRKY